jgi:hypothetical protein
MKSIAASLRNLREMKTVVCFSHFGTSLASICRTERHLFIGGNGNP